VRGDMSKRRVRLLLVLGLAAAATPATNGSPQYYAIFIQDDKIIDSRLGVLLDQCRTQTFQPFDPSRPTTAKKRG